VVNVNLEDRDCAFETFQQSSPPVETRFMISDEEGDDNAQVSLDYWNEEERFLQFEKGFS